jgi:DNA-binding transcriptional MerR regulator
MRISDLSRQTGVPVATIKFYLREGLLPPGEPTGRNQARYSSEHCRLLWLIRVFTNIGGLDLASVRELLLAIKDDDMSLLVLYDVVGRTLFADDGMRPAADEQSEADAEVDRFVDQLSWRVRRGVAGRSRFAEVLVAMQRLGCDYGVEFFLPYAQAAELLSARELDLLPHDDSGGYQARGDRAAAVARAVLLNAAFAALRRMAQEHLVAERLSRAHPIPATPVAAVTAPPVETVGAHSGPLADSLSPPPHRH